MEDNRSSNSNKNGQGSLETGQNTLDGYPRSKQQPSMPVVQQYIKVHRPWAESMYDKRFDNLGAAGGTYQTREARKAVAPLPAWYTESTGDGAYHAIREVRAPAQGEASEADGKSLHASSQTGATDGSVWSKQPSRPNL